MLYSVSPIEVVRIYTKVLSQEKNVFGFFKRHLEKLLSLKSLFLSFFAQLKVRPENSLNLTGYKTTLFRKHHDL